jgi:hypothetical protein
MISLCAIITCPITTHTHTRTTTPTQPTVRNRRHYANGKVDRLTRMHKMLTTQRDRVGEMQDEVAAEHERMLAMQEKVEAEEAKKVAFLEAEREETQAMQRSLDEAVNLCIELAAKASQTHDDIDMASKEVLLTCGLAPHTTTPTTTPQPHRT